MLPCPIAPPLKLKTPDDVIFASLNLLKLLVLSSEYVKVSLSSSVACKGNTIVSLCKIVNSALFNTGALLSAVTVTVTVAVAVPPSLSAIVYVKLSLPI